jgi:antitoxin component of RelBE/YafQ-DinJ toxin-antitoxin module
MYRPLDKTISLRISEADALFLQDQADQLGMTVSQIIRALIRSARQKGECR